MPIVRQRPCPVDQSQFDENWPEWVQRLFLARGVASESELGLSLAELLPPDRLKGIEQATEIVCSAIREQERILIIGDYDADGATSSALMIHALRAFGADKVDFLVPNRFDYGYGLTPEIVALAAQQQPDLLITVDNGIASVAGVHSAREKGMRVVVTDHHLPGSELPVADAIVNPNQPHCGFESKNLAGVGVAFYLLSSIRSSLRDAGWFEQRGITVPKMSQWLDLVALGTVADVVPLDRNNRTLVTAGLKLIRSGSGNPGIRALFEVAGRDWSSAVASDLGFLIGPRINAAGRLDDISHGIRCLLETSEPIARTYASELDSLNRDRRIIQQDMQIQAEAAVAELEDELDELPWGVVLFDPSWHEGVVGLLASRIKEMHHRPVIAFARSGEGELKGSGRSIQGFHLRDALDAVASRETGLLTRFGGHAMAAGLTLKEEHLEPFSRAFDAVTRGLLTESDLSAEIWTDGSAPLHLIGVEDIDWLNTVAPWGQSFPEPLFSGWFIIRDSRVLKEKHLKLFLEQAEESEGESDSRIFTSLTAEKPMEAIWFNVDKQYLKELAGCRAQFVYHLEVNRFRGNRSLQLRISELLELA